MNGIKAHGIRAALLCGYLALFLQGCALMPNSGPSRAQVMRADRGSVSPSGVTIVEVDDDIARELGDKKKHQEFSKVFGSTKARTNVIGPGDTLEISIWETAPAILFRRASLDSSPGAMGVGGETFPAQMVMEDGTITVPFVGRVKAAGRGLKKLENEIASRLEGQANNPHVVARMINNLSAQVSVIGDVKSSRNVPLTPRGEKILDALAAAGGVEHPLNKVTMQLSRKGVNASMPLNKIVEDPKQNLWLQPGDVLSVIFQPWTFSVLGATTRNSEVPFEASGISLAQALSRTGGLNDTRADPGGIFIFRFEDAALVKNPNPDATPVDGKLPVVYRINFNKPQTFFATQHFPMQDKDVLYVANMPAAELEKFLRMVGMVLTPTLNIGRYQLQVAD